MCMYVNSPALLEAYFIAFGTNRVVILGIYWTVTPGYQFSETMKNKDRLVWEITDASVGIVRAVRFPTVIPLCWMLPYFGLCWEWQHVCPRTYPWRLDGRWHPYPIEAIEVLWGMSMSISRRTKASAPDDEVRFWLFFFNLYFTTYLRVLFK